MHELGIVSGILDVACKTAREAGASRVVSVTVRIGDMCETVPEAMDFAWEALREEDPLTLESEMIVERVHPCSACVQCGEEFDHDLFHCRCPKCGSGQTMLLRGRELDIVSLEIETPDEDGPDGDGPDGYGPAAGDAAAGDVDSACGDAPSGAADSCPQTSL